MIKDGDAAYWQPRDAEGNITGQETVMVHSVDEQTSTARVSKTDDPGAESEVMLDELEGPV